MMQEKGTPINSNSLVAVFPQQFGTQEIRNSLQGEPS